MTYPHHEFTPHPPSVATSLGHPRTPRTLATQATPIWARAKTRKTTIPKVIPLILTSVHSS
jgi:hypothetical protein